MDQIKQTPAKPVSLSAYQKENLYRLIRKTSLTKISKCVNSRLFKTSVVAIVGLLTPMLIQPLPLFAQQPKGAEFPVNSTTAGMQATPSIARNSQGDMVIVWLGNGDGDDYGIFAQRYGANAEAVGSEFRVNTYTTNEQTFPQVAMDEDGDFIVVWESNGSSGTDTDFSVQARRFDRDGVALDASEFQVNTYTTGAQRAPQVAMDSDGDTVIVWQSQAANIHMQRYDSTGAKLTLEEVEVGVNNFLEIYPDVASDDEGNFVVTWTSFTGGDPDITARRFANDGAALDASEFQVNTNTTNVTQIKPRIGMDADGDFVIAWFDVVNAATSDYTIYARRYANIGAPLDVNEFQVNSLAGGPRAFDGQFYGGPIVAMDADGDFMITWESVGSFGTDNSSYSIQARRYLADGTALESSEFQINQHTTDGQVTPKVALQDITGDFVLTWASDGQDGSEAGIYAQVYEPNKPEIAVSGNGVDITDGVMAPTQADLTDFGNVVVGETPVEHTFTISNTGSAPLNLTGTDPVTLTNLSENAFSVTLQPITPITVSSYATFTLKFSPTATQTYTATVTIVNDDDDDENPFTFMIQGTGIITETITETETYIYLPLLLKS